MSVLAKDMYAKLYPKHTKRKWLFLSIALICLVAGGIIWWLYPSTPKYIYKTAMPKTATITQIVSAAGTLSPIDTVEVGSQISGRIQEVLVDINDSVQEGQVLATINPEKLNQTLNKQKASLESAKAQHKLSLITLEKAKWNYDRLQELYKRTQGKSPSKLELQTAKLEYENALSSAQVNALNIANTQADVKSSEIDIKNSIILSPINGIVLERSIDPGQTVAASFQTPTLFKLAKSLEEMSLVVNVAEADIGKVQIGQAVRFSVDAYPDTDFSAKVDRVSYAATQDTSNNIISYETRILVNNQAKLLRPGMSASANIIIQTQKDVQTIPVSALFFEPPKQEASKRSFSFSTPPPPRKSSAKTSKKPSKTIYILENGSPTPIEVEVGINDGINAQILSPKLPENTQIITQASQKQ